MFCLLRSLIAAVFAASAADLLFSSSPISNVRVSMSAVSCSMLAVATAIASFASLISLFVFFVSSEHQYVNFA